jgi:uncharacterized protein YukE
MRLKQYLTEAMPKTIGDLKKAIARNKKTIKKFKALLKKTPENKKGKRTSFQKEIDKSEKWIKKYEAALDKLQATKGNSKKQTHSQEMAKFKTSTAFKGF